MLISSFLSETKCSVDSLEPIFLNMGFTGCVGVDAESTSGGLFLCWAKSEVVSVLVFSKNVIVCSVSDPQASNYNVAFVYGSPYAKERHNVWNHISECIDSSHGPWLLMGDFNQVENHSEKLRGSKIIQGVRSFQEWKTSNNLLDIPFRGVRFTWTNNREGQEVIYERIDKAFCNDSWMSRFRDVFVNNLLVLLSDYSPIILEFSPGKR